MFDVEAFVRNGNSIKKETTTNQTIKEEPLDDFSNYLESVSQMRAIHQKLDDMFKCPHCDRLFKMKHYMNR